LRLLHTVVSTSTMAFNSSPIHNPQAEELRLTISTYVVRLDMHTLDLSVLDYEGVALAAVCAEERGGGEFDIKSPGEGTAGVG
jgi:hypothetical protein